MQHVWLVLVGVYCVFLSQLPQYFTHNNRQTGLWDLDLVKQINFIVTK